MSKDLPNIILIITDQQRSGTINGLGAPYMDTPNLDRLVSEGVSFTNSFVSAPSCVPSRASLFSGYYPHNTNVLCNGDDWSPNWVNTLSDQGYQCVNVGKMHTIPLDAEGGFHERFIVENKDRTRNFADRDEEFYDEWDKYLENEGVRKPSRELYSKREDFEESIGAFKWPLEERYHSDVFVGNMAQWWLRNRKADSPFFLEVGFPGPHPPYDPVGKYVKDYMEKDLPLPHIAKDEIESQPSPQHDYRREMMQYKGSKERGPHDAVHWEKFPSKDQLHRLRAYYYANVTMIDEKIGQILKVLEEKGYLENSIVIFTSDHGDALGDHGHIQKWTMYDSIVNTPLVVWAPHLFEGGVRKDALVQQFDLAPAILEYAGLDVPDSWNAKSIRPLLEGDSSELRDYVFSEHGKDWYDRVWRPEGVDFMTMVRSEDWKLVHYLGIAEGELYHLKSDEKEERNLWKDDRYNDKKRELLDVLREWRIRTEYESAPTAL